MQIINLILVDQFRFLNLLIGLITNGRLLIISHGLLLILQIQIGVLHRAGTNFMFCFIAQQIFDFGVESFIIAKLGAEALDLLHVQQFCNSLILHHFIKNCVQFIHIILKAVKVQVCNKYRALLRFSFKISPVSIYPHISIRMTFLEKVSQAKFRHDTQNVILVLGVEHQVEQMVEYLASEWLVEVETKDQKDLVFLTLDPLINDFFY